MSRELLMHVEGPQSADDCDTDTVGVGLQPSPDYDEAIALPFEIIVIVVAVGLILLAYLLTEFIKAIFGFISWYMEQVRQLYGLIFGIIGGIISGIIAEASGKKASRRSDKEKKTDIPEWARGKDALPGEKPTATAKRIMDEKYPDGNYNKGPGSEYSKLKKYFEQRMRDQQRSQPRPTPQAPTPQVPRPTS